MKTFTKTLALAIFATTAVHAMDNQQPRKLTWKEKAVQMIPGPGKVATVATIIGYPVLRQFFSSDAVIGTGFAIAIALSQIEELEPFFNRFKWNSKWSFQKINSQTKTSKIEQCPVCLETKSVIQFNCHPQHFVCPDCLKDASEFGYTKCFMCQKDF